MLGQIVNKMKSFNLRRFLNVARWDLTVNRHTHQMHVMMGCQAPSVFDERKVAFSLLNNIIGGPAMNSRLNVAIREKYGFCYAIESQYTPFSDAGLFYIYAGIDADARQQFDELVRRELRQLADNQLFGATAFALLALMSSLHEGLHWDLSSRPIAMGSIALFLALGWALGALGKRRDKGNKQQQ